MGGRTIAESDRIGEMEGADQGKVASIGGEKKLLLVVGYSLGKMSVSPERISTHG